MGDIPGTQEADLLFGTVNSDTITGLGGNDVLAGSSIDASSLTTILEFDGSGFDASKVYTPAVVKENGQYTMLFGGIPFGNATETGLATSTDGQNWTKLPNPVIANTDTQPWADFRVIPRSLIHEDGLFKLWFGGDNSNLNTDPGYASGFGYATSPDGVNWTFSVANPIRSETNSPQPNLISLAEVVKFNNKYIAYFVDQSPDGNVLYRAVSDDGQNFSDDTPINLGYDYQLVAATTVADTGPYILSVWRKDGQQYIALSDDGLDFKIITAIDTSADFTIQSLLYDAGQLELFGTTYVGNVNWNFGNNVIESTSVPFALNADADILEGGADDDTLLGGLGADEYVFGPNWGNDIIIDPDPTGKLVFDGFAPGDITFTDVGNDRVFTDGINTVTFRNYASNNFSYDIEYSDTPVTISISSTNGNTQAEGNDPANPVPFLFTVTRTGNASEDITLNWVVDTNQSPDVDGLDFVSGVLPSGQITIPGGGDSSSITIDDILVQGDLDVESGGLAELFVVNLTRPADGVVIASAQGAIENDDTVYGLLPFRAEQFEGDGGITPFTFEVSRGGDVSKTALVDWSINFSENATASLSDFSQRFDASSDVNFVEFNNENEKGVVSIVTGQLEFAAGDSNKIIELEIVGDRYAEGQIDILGQPAYEKFEIVLDGVSNAGQVDQNFSSAIGIIYDEDVFSESALSDGFRVPVGYENTISFDASAYWTANYNWSISKNPFGGILGNKYHLGEDWNIPDLGNEDQSYLVYATSNGIVRDIGNANGLGNYVIIEHSLPSEGELQKVFSLYGHMRYFSNDENIDQDDRIEKGDTIQKGDIIGQISNTGTNNSHLHFELFEVSDNDFTKYLDFGVQKINKQGKHVGAGKYSYTFDKIDLEDQSYEYEAADRNNDGEADYTITWHNPSEFIEKNLVVEEIQSS